MSYRTLREGTFALPSGATVQLARNEVVRDDHPVLKVKENRAFFEKVDPPVERATAAPGEKRDTGKPAK